MRKKKIIIISTLILFILFFFFVVRPIILYNQSSISGEKWLAEQNDFIEDLSGFSDTLDDITSLYLIDSISYQDFETHMQSLNEEFIILYAKYQKKVSNIHIKEGSYTTEQKKAVQNIENCYLIMSEILNDCLNEEIASDKNTLSYRYLAAQQAIIKEIAEYKQNIEGEK